ncbi:MAG: UvrD-helicase domain-containing protein [Clostridiales bacterium]|nr:UvrD-helicase domain-containing protein [Clostridiales bacterium]
MIYKGIKDKETREAIVSDKGLKENVILSAGAGSGKTTSLVNRVMALLESGVMISSIVAITFTREAGKLFYVRISEELQRRAGEKDRYETLYKEALSDLDNAFFGTIDSFTNKLLLEHSPESGVPLEYSPIEGSFVIHEVIDEILKDLAMEPPGSFFLLKYEKLREYDLGPGDIRSILLKVAGEDTFTIKLPSWTEPVYSKKELDIVDEILKAGLKLKDAFDYQVLRGRTDDEVNRLITATKMKEYKDAVACLDKEHPANIIKFFMGIDGVVKYCILKECIEVEDELLNRIKELLKNQFIYKMEDDYREGRYYFSLSFARDGIERFNERCALLGRISYQKGLSLLINMLENDIKNGSTIVDYIRKKYRYFLVDELQDNNYMQSKLFNILSGGREGSLFLVGDEMQAIYRFRGGDVENFKALRKKMESDKASGAYILSKNFRSSKPLCIYFNEVFKQDKFFGKEYRDIEMANKQTVFDDFYGRVLDGVYKYKVGGSLRLNTKKGYDRVESTEAENVAGIIKGLIGQEIFTYDHKKQEAGKRTVTFEDIMIITRKKKKLEDYIRRLKLENIPYNVAGRSALGDSNGVKVIKRIIDYLWAPFEDFYKAELLMSEPFSVSEDEYFKYINGEDVEYISSIMKTLESLRKEIEGRTPSGIVKAVINKLSLSLMINLADMEVGNESVYYLLELIRESEEKGDLLHLGDIKAFIEDLMTSKDQEYELSIEGGPRGVRLMNLHKTKGLEAPVVILADCEMTDKNRGPDKYYDYSLQEVKWFTIMGGPYGNTEIIGTGLFNEEMEREEALLDLESRRLKYVAATRAGNILIIPEFYKMERTKDGEPIISNKPSPGAWDDLLIDGIPYLPDFFPNEEVCKLLEFEEEDLGSLKNFKKPSLKRDETLKRVRPSMVELKEEEPSLIFTKEDLIREDEELVRFRDERSLYGTLVHLLMEEAVILVKNGKELSEKRIREIAETGKPENEKILEEFIRILTGVYETFKGGGYEQAWADKTLMHEEDLFKKLKSVEEVYTELPFTLFVSTEEPLFKELTEIFDLEKDKGLYVNGIIDLLYKEGDNYVIVDYKTDSSSVGMEKRHKPQLELYKKILRSMLNLDTLPKAYLYHIPLKTDLNEEEDEGLPF